MSQIFKGGEWKIADYKSALPVVPLMSESFEATNSTDTVDLCPREAQFYTPGKRVNGPDDSRSTARGWQWEDVLSGEFVYRVRGVALN